MDFLAFSIFTLLCMFFRLEGLYAGLQNGSVCCIINLQKMSKNQAWQRTDE